MAPSGRKSRRRKRNSRNRGFARPTSPRARPAQRGRAGAVRTPVLPRALGGARRAITLEAELATLIGALYQLWHIVSPFL
jgi:hypothetical protein